jgi:transcriptional regulator GlxA family with amidase domain
VIKTEQLISSQAKMTIQSLELLRIGVLIPEEVQLLDLATVDLLSMLSKDYLTRAKLPAPLINLGVAEVKIHYIAESKTEPHQTTTAGAIQLTHSIDDKEVQPGELDIIHIPGPFLPPTISDKFKAFVQAHRDYRFAPDKSNKEGRKVDFLVVCTGIFVAGICGILDGKQVTGPRMALFDLQLMFPTASSWDWDRRWKHDGNVWTCGT